MHRMPWLAVLPVALAASAAQALQWQHPANLDDALSPIGTDTWEPRVAMNDRGHALVVWSQSDGKKPQIYMAEQSFSATAGSAWLLPDLADHVSTAGTLADEAVAAIDRSGDALVAWRQWSGTQWQVYLSERRQNIWHHPNGLNDMLSFPGTKAELPALAMNDRGQALVTWQQLRGGYNQIMVAEYDAGQWHKPKSLGDSLSSGPGDAVFAQVALDRQGEALVTWYQMDSDHAAVFVARRVDGAWLRPHDLSSAVSLPQAPGYWPVLAMADCGNRLLSWIQPVDGYTQLFIAGTLQGSAFAPASLADHISPAGSHACFPGPFAPVRLGLDDQGTVLATWTQGQTQSGTSRVMLAEQRGGVWNVSKTLDQSFSPDNQEAVEVTQAINRRGGQAAVAWVGRASGGMPQIYLRNWRAGSWQTDVGNGGQPLASFHANPENTEFGGVSSPQLVMNRRDRAILVWQQKQAGAFRIYASQLR